MTTRPLCACCLSTSESSLKMVCLTQTECAWFLCFVAHSMHNQVIGLSAVCFLTRQLPAAGIVISPKV
jgi:hypothetical protein